MKVEESTLPIDVQRIRADFPILQQMVRGKHQLVYLDNGASTQVPKPVLDAMVNAYETIYSNVHRGSHWLSDQSTDAYETAREKTQAFINAANHREIVFTSGTTAGVNLVAGGWGDVFLKPGDEILLTEMEHHSNLVPWQQLAHRTGVQIKFAPITDDGLLDIDQFNQLLTKKTKLVAITHVSNVLGTINPIKELTEKAHQVGAKVFLDAAQSAPHFNIDVQDLDVDFLVFSGHKMLAGNGIGVLFGKEEILESMQPYMGGGSMIRQVTLEGFTNADIPTRFEAGTPPIVPAIALGAAIDYLTNIGMDKIHQYEQLLTKQCFTVLNQISGVQIIGPSWENRAGIVTFKLTNSKGKPIHANDIGTILDQMGIAIRSGHHCTMPLHHRLGLNASARASFYLYNTLDEIETLGKGIQKVQQMFKR